MFVRRGFTFVLGGHAKLTKIPLTYSVSYSNLGVLGALFWRLGASFAGAKPTKAPLGDETA